MSEIIKLQQAPIIAYEKMQEVGRKVKEKIDALELEKQIVTEDTKQALKDTRADLNKEFKTFEEQRKFIKEAVEKPYKEFEEQYKKFIASNYNEADNTLKVKIYDFENKIKADKENELLLFFNELCQSKNIDFVPFGKVGIKVGVNDALNKHREQITNFIEKIEKDIDLAQSIPESEEYKNEVVFEYKKSLDINSAFRLVQEREKARKEAKEQKQQPTPTAPLQAPQIEGITELYEMIFKVKGTLEELKSLKQFLISNNIQIIE